MANVVGKGNSITFSGFAGGLLGLSIDGIKCTVIDDTSEASSDDTMQFLAGWIDPGSVKASVRWDGTEPPVGTQGSLAIALSNGKTFTNAAAICSDYSASVDFDSDGTADCTFKLSGKSTWGTGSA